MNGFVDFEQYNEQVSIMSERYTRLPNYVIDSGLMAELSDKAFKCYMLITRYTIGYGKEEAQIATSTFQKLTGIKKRDTIFSAILELEQCNLIKVNRTTGVVNGYSLTQNQSPLKGLPSKGTSTAKGDGTSTAKGDGTSTAKRDTNKESIKESIKESVIAQKSPKKQESPACEKAQKFSPMKFLLENKVTEQTAKEYLDLRAKKKKPVTDKVLKIVIRQAEQAQISNELAFQIITVRGWDSFNATWNWQETASQLETLHLDFGAEPQQPEQPKWTAEVMEW